MSQVSGFAVNRKSEGLSRFKHVKDKPDQEKAASSEKDVKRKKCQREEFQEQTQRL